MIGGRVERLRSNGRFIAYVFETGDEAVFDTEAAARLWLGRQLQHLYDRRTNPNLLAKRD